MAENKHTMSDLYQMQSLPLKSKIRMTERRLREWVERFGEGNVRISFSGGKDSNVLLDIARKIYPNIKAIFVDTGLEYPEIRSWVKTFDNVEWLKPKYTFKQVIQKYGYPFISKEVSESVYNAQRYIAGRGGYPAAVRKLCGVGEYGESGTTPPLCDSGNNVDGLDLENAPQRVKMLFGVLAKDNKILSKDAPESDLSRFNCKRYLFFLEDGAPPICNQCCNVMKKGPIYAYDKKHSAKGITAQMASESRLRTQKWLSNGCNGFDMKNPISNPMAFWTEQDILLYIYENHLPICPIYGEVVEDFASQGQTEGQISLSDYGVFDKGRPVLKTTGCKRTGCVFCGYGLHLDKHPNRLEKLSLSHPNLYDYVMRGGAFNENGDWRPDNRGLGYWYCIEWINKHGGFNIGYADREHYLKTYMTEETKRYL